MTTPPPSMSEKPGPPTLGAAALTVAGIAVATACFFYGMVVLVQGARRGAFSGVLQGAAVIAAGLAACGVLAALAWLIVRPIVWGSRAVPPATGQAQEHEEVHWPVMTATLNREHQAVVELSRQIEQLMGRMDEIEQTLLLGPDELAARREQQKKKAGEQLQQRFREAMEQQDYAQAGHVLEEFAASGLVDDCVERLRQELREARNQAESEQFSRAVEHVEDLMAVSRFEQALESARELQTAHPDAKGAAALVERVQREHDTYRNERRARLYGEVEKFVTARRWTKAVEAAETFLDAYPDAPEAELVRVQMDTLHENARIEEVRSYRDRIRDFIERRRFAEAIDLAREVIREFPDTTAAQELRQQLPRLEQLAADKS